MAAADTFSNAVIRDLYQGLTDEAPNGSVVPGVAAGWDVDSSGCEYIFHLRSTAHWSNGAPVTANDFVRAWKRVVDPKSGSPVSDQLRLVTGASAIIAAKAPPDTLGVSAPDDHTLVVHLVKPAGYFPQLVAQPGTYPVYSEKHVGTHDPELFVSNGPFVLKGWNPGSSIDLKRNDNFWDAQSVHIITVQYRFQPDENAQYDSFRAGELDITDTVPAQLVPRLRAAHATELVLSPVLITAYYGFNLSKPPFANNLKLRQSLSMSVDRRRLVETLGSGLKEAYGFVPPGTWNYTPQASSWANWNDAERIATSKKLYAESGYSQLHPLRLRLLYNANSSIKKIAIIVAAMWKETLGVEVELVEEEYRVFLESRRDRSRWDVVRLAWAADYDDAGDFLEIFRSGANNNDEGYENSEVDLSLNRAEQTADVDKRRSLLERVENLILADAPIAPLTYMVSRKLVKPYVKGVQTNPLNHLSSRWLTIAPRNQNRLESN